MMTIKIKRRKVLTFTGIIALLSSLRFHPLLSIYLSIYLSFYLCIHIWFFSAKNSFIWKVILDFCYKIYRILHKICKIQTSGDLELSEQKKMFHWWKISYFNFAYILPQVLLFISSFHIHYVTVGWQGLF